MKNLLLLASMLFVNIAFAQITCCTTTVSEKIEFNGVVRDVFKVEISNAQSLTIKESWNNFVRQNTKSKNVAQANDYLIAKDVKLKGVNKSKVEIVSYLSEKANGLNLFVGFFVDSVYVEPNIENFATAAAKSFLTEFSSTMQITILENTLSAEESKLKSLEAKLKDANKVSDKFRKSISKNEKLISDLNQDVKLNEDQQSLKLSEIKAKRESLIGLSREATNQKKLINKEIKTFEKDLKKLRKENEKIKGKVKDVEADNRNLQFELEKSNKEVEYHTGNLTNQRNVVLEQKDKLKALK